MNRAIESKINFTSDRRKQITRGMVNWLILSLLGSVIYANLRSFPEENFLTSYSSGSLFRFIPLVPISFALLLSGAFEHFIPNNQNDRLWGDFVSPKFTHKSSGTKRVALIFGLKMKESWKFGLLSISLIDLFCQFYCESNPSNHYSAPFFEICSMRGELNERKAVTRSIHPCIMSSLLCPCVCAFNGGIYLI